MSRISRDAPETRPASYAVRYMATCVFLSFFVFLFHRFPLLSNVLSLDRPVLQLFVHAREYLLYF